MDFEAIIGTLIPRFIDMTIKVPLLFHTKRPDNQCFTKFSNALN